MFFFFLYQVEIEVAIIEVVENTVAVVVVRVMVQVETIVPIHTKKKNILFYRSDCFKNDKHSSTICTIYLIFFLFLLFSFSIRMPQNLSLDDELFFGFLFALCISVCLSFS